MAGWILESHDPDLILRLPPGANKTLGRAVPADFIVDATLLSRVHCRLVAGQQDELRVEDLGSTNGTLVNGARVERAALKTGDVLSVGRVEFLVQLDN
jgi:pSer/pThr/pTyr-binding forkhead associated (FHA) protein